MENFPIRCKKKIYLLASRRLPEPGVGRGLGQRGLQVLLELDDEELGGEREVVAGVEAVPQGKEQQGHNLQQTNILFKCQEV